MGNVEVAGVAAATPVSRAWIEAKVIRADGSVEDLGIISDSGLVHGCGPSLLQRVKAKLWPKH